ncbi:hypothetical protein EV356DRAFT_384146 [Viridothelium virens]|uniref:Uncharacterized protein n=1 Tax=Viridothelium virens TaxID=1048519 RepID=A0A6A6HJM3_VIRVR|nr:hypothetical protein EV356DRAFT_384146 [Viridothelium virens]
MSGHQPARLNGAPTPTAAINKKRLAEQVAFPLPSAKSSKRQRTDVPRPTIANVPSQRLVSTIENTPHTESTNSHLFPHNSSSEASPEPENLAVDWKGLLCKLFGADSNTNDETIVQALEQRMQLLQNAYAPVEESRSPSPVQVTPIYHVLHRTRCLRTRHAVVNCIDFDAPFVAEDGHLMSKNRIKNLDVHLAENPALSFIAFQDYRCCTELARRMKAEADPIPSKENIWLISSLLVDALRMAVKEFSHLVPSSMIEEKAEIENPHTWMYHLRDILPGKAADQKEETHAMHLSLFLSYFYDGKKNQFEQVNHLLSQGKITRQHFEYLYLEPLSLRTAIPAVSLSNGCIRFRSGHQ